MTHSQAIEKIKSDLVDARVHIRGRHDGADPEAWADHAGDKIEAALAALNSLESAGEEIPGLAESIDKLTESFYDENSDNYLSPDIANVCGAAKRYHAMISATQTPDKEPGDE